MKIALRPLLGALLVSAVILPQASAQTAPDQNSREAARRLAKGMCMSCHGEDGVSSKPLVPRIAGQQRAYLEAQLKAFRRQNRSDPEAHDYMWGIAATLDDNIVAGLAEYYSKLPAGKGESGDAALIAEGRNIFERSHSDTGVPACTACHGDNAEGHSVFPRLAGQHGQYLARQMQMLRSRLRDSPVMHGVTKDLTDDEIRALAMYLQSK